MRIKSGHLLGVDDGVVTETRISATPPEMLGLIREMLSEEATEMST